MAKDLANTQDYQFIDCPVENHFCGNIYARQITMPRGAFVFGKKHKTTHFNFVMQGSALVYMDGIVTKVTAPAVISSNAETQKIVYILEDMAWITTHATEETDVQILEQELVYEASIEKSLLDDALAKLIEAKNYELWHSSNCDRGIGRSGSLRSKSAKKSGKKRGRGTNTINRSGDCRAAQTV